jgi:hypothetical protein
MNSALSNTAENTNLYPKIRRPRVLPTRLGAKLLNCPRQFTVFTAEPAAVVRKYTIPLGVFVSFCKKGRGRSFNKKTGGIIVFLPPGRPAPASRLRPGHVAAAHWLPPLSAVLWGLWVPLLTSACSVSSSVSSEAHNFCSRSPLEACRLSNFTFFCALRFGTLRFFPGLCLFQLAFWGPTRSSSGLLKSVTSPYDVLWRRSYSQSSSLRPSGHNGMHHIFIRSHL